MHEHLRSYVGQARIALHSTVRQLELAEDALRSTAREGGYEAISPLIDVAADVSDLIRQLTPLRDRLIHTHTRVVQHR